MTRNNKTKNDLSTDFPFVWTIPPTITVETLEVVKVVAHRMTQQKDYYQYDSSMTEFKSNTTVTYCSTHVTMRYFVWERSSEKCTTSNESSWEQSRKQETMPVSTSIFEIAMSQNISNNYWTRIPNGMCSQLIDNIILFLRFFW